MIISGGALRKGPDIVWGGSPSTWNTSWPTPLPLGQQWASYSEIYRRQLWVAVLVNKLAKAKARLPLKVYERGDRGREEVRDHPYAELLRRPNARWSSYFTWLWVSSTFDVFGESFLGKIRDQGGRPVELVPLHPTAMRVRDERDSRLVWDFQNGTLRIENIPQEDLIHFRTYNPDSVRGLSPLEPLRRSLEHEDASRRATTAFWQNGARPGVVLSHPGTLSKEAGSRLKLGWDAIAGGADNTGKTVVLEEGMKPEIMQITAEEAQYIESHKMHVEEACAIYDVPPPVVHVLDRATYSNITEQMRSMYRDTMAPRLKSDEAELETQLRASVRPGASEPDFGGDVYAEFLLDEVLRGDFEARSAAYMSAINSGQLTPAEVREMENRPFIEGSDRLFINSTMVPIGEDDDVEGDAEGVDTQLVDAVGVLIRSGFDPAAVLAALGLPPMEHLGLLPITLQSEEVFEADADAATADAAAIRMVMGRLSRTKALEDVDPVALVADLNGHSGFILEQLALARAAGLDVAGLRAWLGLVQRDPGIDPAAIRALAPPGRPVPGHVKGRLTLLRDDSGTLIGLEEADDGSR